MQRTNCLVPPTVASDSWKEAHAEREVKKGNRQENWLRGSQWGSSLGPFWWQDTREGILKTRGESEAPRPSSKDGGQAGDRASWPAWYPHGAPTRAGFAGKWGA